MEATIRAAFDTPVTSYPSMLNQIFPHMSTSYSSNQMLGIGTRVVSQNIRTIEQKQFPDSNLGRGEMINGVYYFTFDIEKGAELLRQYIYEDMPWETAQE